MRAKRLSDLRSGGGTELLALAVIRTWHDTPQDAVACGGVYGVIDVSNMTSEHISNIIEFAEGVRDASGAPDEYEYIARVLPAGCADDTYALWVRLSDLEI